jgi:hypothetical protein
MCITTMNSKKFLADCNADFSSEAAHIGKFLG